MKNNLIFTSLRRFNFHLSFCLQRTMRLLLGFGLTLGTALMLPPAWAQSAMEVGANTTVYFSDTLNPLVLEDKSGTATLDQVRNRLFEFKPADTVGKIDPKSQYWVVQKLVNRIGENRDFIVDAGRTDTGINWVRYQHYVVYPDGKIRELNGPYSDNVP